MTSMEAEERVLNTEKTNNMETKASNLSHKKIQQNKNPKKQIKYNTWVNPAPSLQIKQHTYNSLAKI